MEISNSSVRKVKEKKKFAMPNTLVIMAVVIALVAVATYLIPGGAYDRVLNDQGREVVVSGTYKAIASQPQSLFDVLQSPIEGIVQGGEIIAFLFIVGGAFSIVSRTKAIDLGILKIVNVFKGKEILVLPILMFMFSIGGATFGMSEEAIAFVAVLMPLVLALGYDSIVAVAITYLACNLGFSAAMLNPFTVGIAQSIAGIQLYSGVEFRTLVWFVSTLVGCGFVMFYAMKIKKNPELSPMFEHDQVKREKLKSTESEHTEFTLRHKIIIAALFTSIALVVYGVLKLEFWIPQIAAVFLGLGIISGLVGKLAPNEIAEAFTDGAKDMIGAAIMIGLAKSVMIIAQNANIIDTILFNLANVVGQLPSLIASYIMFVIQMFINFFVSSGSGQAALTMPILAPLGDLVGISRQLSVLIYQLGDGFSNAMFPTSGVLIACLGMAGVPYGKWLKWILPLQAILFMTAIVFITIASLIGWA